MIAAIPKEWWGHERSTPNAIRMFFSVSALLNDCVDLFFFFFAGTGEFFNDIGFGLVWKTNIGIRNKITRYGILILFCCWNRGQDKSRTLTPRLSSNNSTQIAEFYPKSQIIWFKILPWLTKLLYDLFCTQKLTLNIEPCHSVGKKKFKPQRLWTPHFAFLKWATTSKSTFWRRP